LAAGMSPKVVSEQLGHASAAFTLGTYAHVLPRRQDEAATKVEVMLLVCGGSDAGMSHHSGIRLLRTFDKRMKECRGHYGT